MNIFYKNLVGGNSPALLHGVHNEGQVALDLAGASEETQNLQKHSFDPHPWCYLRLCPVVGAPRLQLLQLLPHLLISIQLQVLRVWAVKVGKEGCVQTKLGIRQCIVS